MSSSRIASLDLTKNFVRLRSCGNPAPLAQAGLLGLLMVLMTTAPHIQFAHSEEVAMPDPIAHWKLEDTSDQAIDSVGKHHGMIHGATPHKGKLGNGLLFVRDEGDHISVPFSPDFKTGTFTVSAWVWLTKEPTFSGILGTRTGGEFNFDMKVNTDKVHGDIGDGVRWIETKVNFYQDDRGSNGEGGDLQTERWYMITFVVDNHQNECRLYLDGDKKKTIPFHGEPQLMREGQTMRIGDTGRGEFMDGVIDEVRVWNTALTDDQVKQLK
jgi:hypothetical protein